MNNTKPMMEMAAVMVMIRRAGDRGISRCELHKYASPKLLIDEAIECLRIDGVIHRIDQDHYCATPDHRYAPQISLG